MTIFDTTTNKINAECAMQDIMKLKFMFDVRLEAYNDLENLSEGTIQSYLFEKYVATVLKSVEKQISAVYYGLPELPKIEESDN